jgi:glycosyltransferase involved in cell wall biosynthesis
VISFVVPAYNEEKYLAPTLAAIHAAAAEAGEPYEIVVANDNSADATAAVAEQGGARVVTVEKRQIAGTRNAGARASTGDMLIFVDADTTVNGPLVAEAVAAMRAGAVGGGAPVRLDRSPWWLALFMRLLIPVFRMFKWAAGCFVFCTREAFEKAGGFDEQYFASEEIHFSQAMKRHGRFVILRGFVVSSSRKLDSHGFWAFIWLCLRLGIRGRAVVRSRGGGIAEFWYPDKR